MLDILRKVRWSVLFLSIGCVLTFVGGCYALRSTSLPSTVALLVGVPMSVVGLGLKGAELAPIEILEPTPEIEAVRNKATVTQNQIMLDVTRYQYGMSVHLEPALEKLGLESEENNQHPTLLSIQEAAIEDSYALILTFGSLDLPYEIWTAKEEQMTKFFGPGVNVTTTEVTKNKKFAVTIATV
jgi:Protein of unknown function (DUF2854)